MRRYVNFFLLVIIVQHVASDSDCIADLKFNVSAWKMESAWVAGGMVDSYTGHPSPEFYDYSDFPEVKSTKLDGFTVKVDVEQCGSLCDNGPYVEITAFAKRNPGRILPDYDQYPGIGSYKFHTKPTSWDDARRICNEEGTHLAVINSEAESQIFRDYLASVPQLTGSTLNDFAYIGFHDRFVHGQYLTIYDQLLSESGFFRWFGSDQPDNAGGDEFCGSVHRNGGLNDISCNLRFPFICEQDCVN